MAKKKAEKIDGLSPDDLKKIHKAVRQCWSWSYPRRLAKARALGPDGFYYCESPDCPNKGKPVPKIEIDHINAVGVVGGPGYIEKMFVPSCKLISLCSPCHRKKTNAERKSGKIHP